MECKKICTGTFDDRLKVKEEYKDLYDDYYNSTIIHKNIFYLNGVNFVNGVQGSGKTYLVKSIISNKSVDKELNNVFWLKEIVDMEFIVRFFELKKILYEGLKLLFEGKLHGNYHRRWVQLTEKDHMVINKERIDFKIFDPCLYDLVVLDDIASNQVIDCLIPYATILRHIHCGIVFIGQTETILNKKYRDLMSLYITFNSPDNKILKPKIRNKVIEMITKRDSTREAVAYDMITEEVYYICAEDDGKVKKEEEIVEEKETKITPLQKFKDALDSFNF